MWKSEIDSHTGKPGRGTTGKGKEKAEGDGEEGVGEVEGRKGGEGKERGSQPKTSLSANEDERVDGMRKAPTIAQVGHVTWAHWGERAWGQGAQPWSQKPLRARGTPMCNRFGTHHDVCVGVRTQARVYIY